MPKPKLRHWEIGPARGAHYMLPYPDHRTMEIVLVDEQIVRIAATHDYSKGHLTPNDILLSPRLRRTVTARLYTLLDVGNRNKEE